MPYIENISLIRAMNGDYQNEPKSSVMIRILDPDADPEKFPIKGEFSEQHIFYFGDVGYDLPEDFDQSWKFNKEQAYEIASILQKAASAGKDVTVHCSAGLCRSGAVVEAALRMNEDAKGSGFTPRLNPRRPNTYVLSLLKKELGIDHDSKYFEAIFGSGDKGPDTNL